MKKINLVFLFVLFLGTAVFAQNTSIGLRAGLNIANISHSGGSANHKSLIGANFGAFINRSIHPNWGITGELNFTMRGWQDEVLGKDLNTRINYLEVPIYINYFFLKQDSKIRPKLFAGGYGSYLMTASFDGVDTKQFYENIDYGLLLGGGLHYSLGGGTWLIFDVRYGLGLADITKATSDIKNRNLSFNIGYSFPLGNTE